MPKVAKGPKVVKEETVVLEDTENSEHYDSSVQESTEQDGTALKSNGMVSEGNGEDEGSVVPSKPSKRSGKPSTKQEEPSESPVPATKPTDKVTKGKEKPLRPLKKVVIYSEREAIWKTGDDALTVEQAKALLGWEEEPLDAETGKPLPGEKWEKGTYLFKDMTGRKIRCLNNLHNRPFDLNWCKSLAYEHLNLNWEVNGETIIIGEYGSILSAQHRLVSHVLAEQVRLLDLKLKRSDRVWMAKWRKPVTMESLVVYGIKENDKLINTIDTGRPRSVSDIIYRSTLFDDLTGTGKRTCCKMTEWAIRLLWERTGADLDAHTPYRTHSESMDYLARHPSILKCVKHIFEENGNGQIANYLTPGYASGLLYLMATSESDLVTYQSGKVKNEKTLNFDRLEAAREFWTLLAEGNSGFSSVVTTFKRLGDGDFTNVKRVEAEAVIVNAWNAWVGTGEFLAEDISIDHNRIRNEDGKIEYIDLPDLGGIDLGPTKDRDEGKADGETDKESPTSEVVSDAGPHEQSEPTEADE